MRRLKVFILVLFAVFQLNVFAAAPIDMLQATTDSMITALKKISDRSPENLYRLVQNILLPQVDLNYMSQLVINQPGQNGNYWGNATAQQKAQFTQAFTRYVTRTYSGALANYSNEKIIFSPRITQLGSGRIQVNSQVQGAGKQPINLNYRLIQSGGNWKVYDLVVDSISMVNSYNEQFGPVLRQGGMEGLLQRLQQRK